MFPQTSHSDILISFWSNLKRKKKVKMYTIGLTPVVVYLELTKIIPDENVYMCFSPPLDLTHKSEKQPSSHGLLSLDLPDIAHFALLNLPLVSP